MLEGQYRVTDKFYAGLKGKLKDEKYSPDNLSGQEYLTIVNAVDTTSVDLGVVMSYDSRDNRFYPYDGIFSEISFTPKPESLGNETDYYVLEGFVNGYSQYRKGHVIAWRFFGRSTPDDTPYSDLSTIGQRSDLRGYVSGENIANNLVSAQVEYRWQFRDDWAIVGFVGEVALFNNNDFSSDSLYFSAGAGIRYMLSKERRVNLRIDFAVGEDESDAFYIGISEAFLT
jgi:outer membrane protein assembly factor BamA